MYQRWLLFLTALAVLCGLTSPASAREPLVDQVRDSIKRGIQFLRDQQVVGANGAGHWEVDQTLSFISGGETSLALLALLNAGVKPDDPVIKSGLKYLRSLEVKEDSWTYSVSLQTMVYSVAGYVEDRERIQRNVEWLIKARVFRGDELVGWTYKQRPDGNRSDNSNTQYALLGLHEAHLAGARIDPAVWKSIRQFYITTQCPDPVYPDIAAWGYIRPDRKIVPGKKVPLEGDEKPRLTMTTAGVSGLIISGEELNVGREQFQGPGRPYLHCGDYQENQALAAGVGWINKRFKLDLSDITFPATYYNLYGIERVGRLTGLRYLGGLDWYRAGCEYLVKQQSAANGSWVGKARSHDQWPIVSTSFALLFLSKGRTPVLISKLVHGPGDDWNNDRNDARHLTGFVSREVFKRQPLAWQVFETKAASIETDAKRREVVAEMLQAPVLYFNGHQAPEFSKGEVALLKEYIDQGGFIFAEACCGDKRFHDGFVKLMKEVFNDDDAPAGDNPLVPLERDHPVWRAFFPVSPEKDLQLFGVKRGCKTVVIYSPQDLSCAWEANQPETPRGQRAFRLGANVVAYATGLEMPKPRLTEVEVVSSKEESRIPRGYLKVAQLKHTGDWHPAPKAMPNFMSYLRDKPRLDVALQTETLHPADERVLDFKFLYLHGRADFTYNEKATENLRANLQTGGLLFADACCGMKAFDKAFRTFANNLFPGKRLEPIPLTDELYSKELNGEPISTVRCRTERPDGSGPEASYREVPPYLEGIKIDNRWVVIYSKYDIGCGLEKRPSTDCLGHDYPSALKLGGAAVLYALKR